MGKWNSKSQLAALVTARKQKLSTTQVNGAEKRGTATGTGNCPCGVGCCRGEQCGGGPAAPLLPVGVAVGRMGPWRCRSGGRPRSRLSPLLGEESRCGSVGVSRGGTAASEGHRGALIERGMDGWHSEGCFGLTVKPPTVWEFGAVEQKRQKDPGKGVGGGGR